MNTCERCDKSIPDNISFCPECESANQTEAQINIKQEVDSVSAGGTVIGVHYETTIHESADALPAFGESPYQGLHHFDVKDADRFFGREKLTAQLVDQLRDSPMLAIIGASGSGKSSVARAGVLAALKNRTPLANGVQAPAGSENWPFYIIKPGAYPLERIAEAVTDSTSDLKALVAEMKDKTDALCKHMQRIVDTSFADHALVFVDQFEEVFTLCHDESEQHAFVYNLLNAVGLSEENLTSKTGGSQAHSQQLPPTRLLLAMSAESYAECAKFDQLRLGIDLYQQFIGSMSTAELRSAIEAPAWQDKWAVEPGLVDLILRDIGEEAGRLPLLSHALLEIWKRRRGRILTLAGYQAAGSVQGAIASTADAFYKELDDDDSRLIKDIFLRLITIHPNRSATRRRVSQQDLFPDDASSKRVYKMVNQLVDARLITVGASKTTDLAQPIVPVELAHESLIRAWPQLGQWISENKSWLAIRNRLSDAAQRWQDIQEDSGALYRGHLLNELTGILERNDLALSALEKKFYEASVANADNERTNQRRNLRRKRLLYTLAAAIVSFSGLLILTFSPVWQEQDISDALTAERQGSVHRIALNPTDEDSIYLLDEGSGVLQSKTGGHDWERIAESNEDRINDVASVNQTLYLATDGGLAVSHDRGQTWVEQSLEITGTVTALAIDPLTPNILYAAVGMSILTTDEDSNSWIPVELELTIKGPFVALTHTGSALIVLNNQDQIAIRSAEGWRTFDPKPSFSSSQPVDIAAYGTQGRFLVGLQNGTIVDAEQSTNHWNPLRELSIPLNAGAIALAADAHGYYIAGAVVGSSNKTIFACRRKWNWTEQNWWRTRFRLQVPCIQ